jgi:hypothetical protein
MRFADIPDPYPLYYAEDPEQRLNWTLEDCLATLRRMRKGSDKEQGLTRSGE